MRLESVSISMGLQIIAKAKQTKFSKKTKIERAKTNKFFTPFLVAKMSNWLEE